MSDKRILIRNRLAISLFLTVSISCLYSYLLVSNDSLWIDEGMSAAKAICPTLRSWWENFLWERNSNLQLPLYHLYIWGWEKLFGASEYILRLANIPFLMGCIFVISGLFKRTRQYLWAVGLFVVHPFVWYICNEVRPYMLLLFSGFLMIYALRKLELCHKASEVTIGSCLLFVLSCILLISTSMITLPLIVFASLSVVYYLGIQGFLSVVKKYFALFGLFIAVMLAWGAYYYWTISIGARVPPLSWGTDLKNLLFAFYEFSGFSGLGPSRNNLRSITQGTKPEILLVQYVSLGLLAITNLYVLIRGIIVIRQCQRKRILYWGIVLLSLPIVFVMGYLSNSRILGRHLTGYFPFYCVGIASVLIALWRENNKRAHAAVFLYLGLLLCSTLALRFSPRHKKDAYREVSMLARQAVSKGHTVYWVADCQSAVYYDVIDAEVLMSKRSEKLTPYSQMPISDLLEKPDVVILSKPDIYDQHGEVRKYLKVNKYTLSRTFTSFEIWSH